MWDARAMVQPSMRTSGQEFAGKVQHVCGRGPGALGDVEVLFLDGPTSQERNLGSGWRPLFPSGRGCKGTR